MPVRELKQQIIQRKKAQLPTPPLPAGVYHVLYVDPPWDIESLVFNKWREPLSYPTMTEDELKHMDLPKLAEDCIIFLWTTLSTVQQALNLLAYWGFMYHITITWDKGSGFCMSGFHRKSELVLVGYQGVLSKVLKQEGEYIPTVFYEAKTTHSTKPIAMYEFIETRTIGNKIELFARKRRKGWEAWGNQL